MENAKEARRRRILERGSDRLAFITGQARSIPSPSSSSSHPPPPEKEEHQQDFISPSSNNDATSSHLLDQYSSNGDTSRTAREMSENEISNGISKFHEGDDMPINDKEDDISTYEPGNGNEVNELQYERDTQLLSTSIAQRSSEEVKAAAASTVILNKQVLFSSKQIGHAVSTSENMRLLCASTVALLVVISNRGFALGSSVVWSTANFRPLLLVILTDLFIFLWLLMTGLKINNKQKERVRTGTQESSSWIGDTLEKLLMFYSVARSVSMDCSLCAVIIISGLCI